MSRKYLLLWVLLLPLFGCQQELHVAPQAAGSAPLFLSVVSDMDSNAQAVDMAMKLAGFALDEGREVFLFFNVKGVNVPLASLSTEASFGDGPTIKQQLTSLLDRGASMHACPVCMKALNIDASDLAEGVKVTDRAALFSKIASDTCVFTY